MGGKLVEATKAKKPEPPAGERPQPGGFHFFS
jgi:hypothetical protein